MTRTITSVSSAIVLTLLCLGFGLAQDREEREGGIVGTGIVGTITDLGSIYVNGQHIRFDDGQTVSSPLGDRPAASLVPGETVVVEAVRDGDAWRAETISAYLPIVGPIGSVSARNLDILGAAIAIPADAPSPAAFAGATLAPGDWVAVSGFWKGDTVVASRIERIAPLPMASVVGTYRSADGINRVGAVRMTGIDLRHARPLDVLTVHGAPTDDGLDARAVAIGLFSGPVGEVLFEGYLSDPNLQGAYTVQGSGFLAYVGSPGMATDPDRGLFCGSIDGVTTIERVLDLPEARSLRDDHLVDFGRERPAPCVDRANP